MNRFLIESVLLLNEILEIFSLNIKVVQERAVVHPSLCFSCFFVLFQVCFPAFIVHFTTTFSFFLTK